MEPAPGPARRPRGSLSRDAIVDAALALIDAEGLDALSMPRLARSVGCGVMTLYGYVADKDELVDLVVARVLERVETPEVDLAPLEWTDWAREWVHRVRAALLAHPEVGRLLARSELKKSPAVLRQLDTAVAVLNRAGFGPADAVRRVWALLVHVLGFVQWEVPRTRSRPREDYVREWRMIVAGLPDDHRALPPAVDALVTVADDEQFEFGLEALLAGLRRPVPPA